MNENINLTSNFTKEEVINNANLEKENIEDIIAYAQSHNIFLEDISSILSLDQNKLDSLFCLHNKRLSKASEILEISLNKEQKIAIIVSHYSGDHGVFNLSTKDIKEKYKCLQHCFDDNQIRLLFHTGIIGLTDEIQKIISIIWQKEPILSESEKRKIAKDIVKDEEYAYYQFSHKITSPHQLLEIFSEEVQKIDYIFKYRGKTRKETIFHSEKGQNRWFHRWIDAKLNNYDVLLKYVEDIDAKFSTDEMRKWRGNIELLKEKIAYTIVVLHEGKTKSHKALNLKKEHNHKMENLMQRLKNISD